MMEVINMTIEKQFKKLKKPTKMTLDKWLYDLCEVLHCGEFIGQRLGEVMWAAAILCKEARVYDDEDGELIRVIDLPNVDDDDDLFSSRWVCEARDALQAVIAARNYDDVTSQLYGLLELLHFLARELAADEGKGSRRGKARAA